jgi:predicted Mrr-cat superfamily restriction endonuclease
MNLFQLKANPQGIDRMAEFLKDNFVSIEWAGLGDLDNVSMDEIRDRLARVYKVLGQELEERLAEISSFVHAMQDGDYVLVANDESVHLGDLGDYYYVDSSDTEEDGRCHRRGVTWLKSLPRAELSGVLQAFLGHQGAITKFEHAVSVEQLEYWLSHSPIVSSARGDRINVSNETVEEALTILKLAMLSDDIERRERAAIAILRYAKQ